LPDLRFACRFNEQVVPMYDSPIDWCMECKQWVALDEECRKRATSPTCPLAEALAKAAAATSEAEEVA
jgi:hypothetical protein